MLSSINPTTSFNTSAMAKMFPIETELDQCFAACVTVHSNVLLKKMLSDLCKAYLKIDKFDKAYYAILHAYSKNICPSFARIELHDIIDKCFEIRSPASLAFAKGIYERHKDVISFSRSVELDGL